MEQTRNWHGRAVFRWICGLAAILTGFATVFLFCTTSKPIPSNFIPWSEMGWLPPWDHAFKPEFNATDTCFVCFSECGRYYAVRKPQRQDIKWRPFGVAIHESLSRREVVQIEFERELPRSFCLSSDGAYLASLSEYRHLHVFRWPSGEAVHKALDIVQGDNYAMFPLPETRTVLLAGARSGSMWDLENGKRISSWRIPAVIPEWKMFMSPDGGPMALCSESSSAFQLRNVMTNVPVWQSQDSPMPWHDSRNYLYNGRPVGPGGDLQSRAVSPDARTFAERGADEAICIRSMEDGELLPIQPRSEGEVTGPQFSHDGRFLCFFQMNADPWKTLVKRLPANLRPERILRLDDRIEVVLFDLHTGRSWPGIQASPISWVQRPYVRFVGDQPKLVTLTAEGFCEWDVPPQWRYFTPWAWLALAAFTVLGWGWWRIGRTKG